MRIEKLTLKFPDKRAGNLAYLRKDENRTTSKKC